jgi:hypothetical protein
LSCRYAAKILIVRLSDHSIIRPFVRPNNLFPAVMLSKFRSFVRPIIRSFVRSFIVPIHRSSFVHTTIHHHYPPLLFIVTIHRYHSPTLFIVVTIQWYYSSSLLFINGTYNNFLSSLFIVTIHRSSDHPQISTTHPSCCPVHLRLARPISQSHELW